MKKMVSAACLALSILLLPACSAPSDSSQPDMELQYVEEELSKDLFYLKDRDCFPDFGAISGLPDEADPEDFFVHSYSGCTDEILDEYLDVLRDYDSRVSIYFEDEDAPIPVHQEIRCIKDYYILYMSRDLSDENMPLDVRVDFMMTNN